MIGRRIYPDEDGYLHFAPGDYGLSREGIWQARPPTVEVPGLEKQQHPLVGSLESHTVTEHEDGTISVDPSIEINYSWGDPPVQIHWHGFLEKGVWRLA